MTSLAEIAWTFYMLHGNMQANFYIQWIDTEVNQLI